MSKISFKPIMIKILTSLGFQSPEDEKTVVSPDAFVNLDENLVIQALYDYKMHFADHGGLRASSNLVRPLSEEMKFQIVNRILELKHGMIIDPVKEFDDRGTGFGLENMPAGY